MIHESVLRPVINSLLWAQKQQDPNKIQEMVRQCVQYLEHLQCDDIDLYKELQKGEIPSFSMLYHALQRDERIEVQSSLRFGIESEINQIEVAVQEHPEQDAPEDIAEDSVTTDRTTAVEEQQDEFSVPPVQEKTVQEQKEEPQISEQEREILRLRKRIAVALSKKTSKKQEKEHNIIKSVAFWTDSFGKKPLDSLDFISAEILEQFSEKGIVTIADLLLFPPLDFQRYAQSTLSPTMPDGQYIIRGQIVHKCIRYSPHMDRWEVILAQNGHRATIFWNEEPRGWSVWTVGESIGFVGEVEIEDDIRVFGAEPLGLHGKGSGLMAEYGLIDEQTHRNLIAKILVDYGSAIQDPLPNDILDASKQMSFSDALRDAHFPANREFRGRQRLAFDEVFSYLLCNRLRDKKEALRGHPHQLMHEGIAQLGRVRNIFLNDDQEIIFSKIRRELSSDQPMKHILQGDVGSGKILIAFFCASLIAATGKTVFYIASSEHDAERRFLSAETLFSEIGVKAQLVPHDLSKAQQDALERNELQVIFGTEQLLSPDNQQRVSFVIIEELEEEVALAKMAKVFPKKKIMPDILFFSPFPLPLNSLEKYFSDMSLSVLNSPNVRHPKTLICTAEQRTDVYGAVAQQLEQGRQAYIVLPRQKEKDLISLADALNMAGKVREAFLPTARIGVYSTEMSRIDRMRVFEDFQHKRIDVLFCTAHIEDVPAVRNVSCVVLEYADKNTFMRVHRLRGLILGSYYDASCYLMLSPQTSPEKLEEMKQIAHQNNGFSLCEQGNVPEIDYRWVEGEAELRIQARKLANMLNYADVLRGRWPLLLQHMEGLWPQKTINTQIASKKSKHRRIRKKRR